MSDITKTLLVVETANLPLESGATLLIQLYVLLRQQSQALLGCGSSFCSLNVPYIEVIFSCTG